MTEHPGNHPGDDFARSRAEPRRRVFRARTATAVLAMCLAGCVPQSEQPTTPPSPTSGERNFYQAQLPAIARACTEYVAGNNQAFAELGRRGYTLSTQKAVLSGGPRLIGDTQVVTVILGQEAGRLFCKSTYSGQVGFALYQDYLDAVEGLEFERKEPEDGAIFERGNVKIQVTGKGRSGSEPTTFTLTKL